MSALSNAATLERERPAPTLDELGYLVIEAPTKAVELQPELGLPEPSFVLPRPTNSIMKALLKGPILMWRLGLGRVMGHHLMVMTTTGRKSGLPRRTAIGFTEHEGGKYILTLRGPNTDWFRNMLADPRVTIQTAEGSEPVVARRVTRDFEIAGAYDFLAHMPVMKRWAGALGVQLSRDELIAHKDDFILISFDPTDEPTPAPLEEDLVWAWPVLGAALLLVGLLFRLAKR